MNALEIISFISFSSNTEVSKVSSWGAVKKESLNGLNRAIRVLWNSKEWNFRREIIKQKIDSVNSTYIFMPNALIAQNGITIDNNALKYDKKIPFYEKKVGKPEFYFIDRNDKIRFYPEPDNEYEVTLETFDMCSISDVEGNKKTYFTAADDTVNVPKRLEDLFVDCLNYFCNEILNGDPTDEEYQEHLLRHSEVYKLLERADLATFDNDDSKGFIMPWQQ